jgi:hypothetical protein
MDSALIFLIPFDRAMMHVCDPIAMLPLVRSRETDLLFAMTRDGDESEKDVSYEKRGTALKPLLFGIDQRGLCWESGQGRTKTVASDTSSSAEGQDA